MPRVSSPLRPCLVLVLVALCQVSASVAQDSNVPRGMCELAVEPAATLLLPYFEVDLNQRSGTTTLFSVNNAWQEPALVNITLWTDFGVPTVNFQVYLTGYDVVTVNVRDLFNPGNLPITADEGSDPMDTISPHGDHPEWDASFPECDNFFPFFVNPLIVGALQERFTAYHTGAPSPVDGLCNGSNQGDGHARGYITLDSVRECTLQTPAERSSGPESSGYFVDGGMGVATNNNQLWGDFYLVDPQDNFAVGEPMVHIQAFDSVADGVWQPGDKTFYGHYLDDSAQDNREPLPSTFGMRFLAGGTFDGGTQVLAWRESETTQGTFCDEPPSLTQREVYAWNEQEDVEELCFFPGCPVCSPPFGPFFYDCLPLASQRADIEDDPSFQSPSWDGGWIYMDLNQRAPEEVPRQAWVLSQVSAEGRFSVGLPAVSLHSACDGLPEPKELDTFNF